jgi:DNA-binding response OmpR family regulator
MCASISGTTLEFAVLRVLAERAGRVLSREPLLQLAQASGDEAFDRSIDVHVSRLRHKLGDDPQSAPAEDRARRGLILTPDDA